MTELEKLLLEQLTKLSAQHDQQLMLLSEQLALLATRVELLIGQSKA
jgi:hypothetical protein